MKDVVEYIKEEQELIDLEYELIEKMVQLRKSISLVFRQVFLQRICKPPVGQLQ